MTETPTEAAGECDCGAYAERCICNMPGGTDEPPMTAEEEEEADLRCEGCIRVGCPDCDSCDCTACSRTAAAPPPQPERRPPTAVAYSVLGHLYEVALPGDATVEAVDGALVIRHGLGPVAGICAVNPMRLEN